VSLLKSRRPTAIYCSPLPHAVSTIAPLFNDDEVTARICYCSWLREVDTGDWEGKTYNQVADDYPELLEAYLRDPTQHQFPRGERLMAAYERASAAFRELVCQDNDEPTRIVLVGHPWINRLILTDYCGADIQDHRHIDQFPGRFTVIRYAFGEPELQSIGAAVV